METQYAMEMPDQSEEWTKILSDLIGHCESQQDLMEAANDMWHFRNFKDAWKYALPQYRSQARKLGISTNTQVVAVDYECIEDIGQLRQVYAACCPTVFLFLVKPGIQGQRREEAISVCKSGKNVVPLAADNPSDWLSSIAYRAQLLQQRCILVTEDERVFQCLGAKTAMYSPSTTCFKNADWLMANHHIAPQQVADWLCISNDSTDKVTRELASEWLQAYKDIDGISAMAGKLQGISEEELKDFLAVYHGARQKYVLTKTISVTWQY